jgi:hypothetical protein
MKPDSLKLIKYRVRNRIGYRYISDKYPIIKFYLLNKKIPTLLRYLSDTYFGYVSEKYPMFIFYLFFEKNKMNPKRAKDFVYVHTNFQLLSKKYEEC